VARSILVTGGTGFIGSALVRALLGRGDRVTVLGRDAGRIRLMFEGAAEAIPWQPNQPGPWVDALSSADAVVHLAGEQAVGRRYTPGTKVRIRESRVKSTRHLVEAMGQASPRPQALVCASAVGYYGSKSPGALVDESSPVGSGFLAELCHEWESAAVEAEALGLRVVRARLGAVLGPGGGALAPLARLFRLGLGGAIGNGRQMMSFIHLNDAVKALLRLIDDASLSGPVNLTTAHAVDNATFTACLARVLHRPALARVPSWALRLVYGEGADALLGGQRAVPRVLERARFEWEYPEIDQALRACFAGTLRRGPGTAA